MKGLCYLLIVLFLFSCKKDDLHKESVSGIVLHSLTNQPLANQLVALYVINYRIGEKDSEFPNGRPIITRSNYTTYSDASGKYVFNFEVPENWSFHIKLKKGIYSQKQKTNNNNILFTYVPANSGPLDLARQLYDTLYGERSGYVKYFISNINDTHSNDTLKIARHYNDDWYIQTNPGFFLLPNEDKWQFIGQSVNTIFIDTIPAESEPQIPVKWLHKRTDTITFKNEMINVSPGNTTDYVIHY